MSFWRLLVLSLETVRRMKVRQIIARLSRRARFKWLYPWLGKVLYPRPAALLEAVEPGSTVAFDESAVARALPPAELKQRAEALAEHRFSFLNLPEAPLGRPVDWWYAPAGANRLWQYNLHYGEWALTLARASVTGHSAMFRQALIDLLNDWVDHNPPGSVPGWEPYPLSRRLVAWSRLLAMFAEDTAWQTFRAQVLEPSLRQQARFLAANLEHDVPNNHLLANYRALAWLGLLCEHWPESGRWRRRGLAGLWREMIRQVLPDGGHNERSISYHTIVLQDLLETWWLARSRGVTVPSSVERTLRQMLGFLAATRAPDGSWPMVNDSVPGYPIDPQQVLCAGSRLLGEDFAGSQEASAYAVGFCGAGERASSGVPAEASPVSIFARAGYGVLRDTEGGYLFFDAGPMGPRAIPGHGHADALSLVLYGGGRPLIVDPGVETYEEGGAPEAIAQ